VALTGTQFEDLTSALVSAFPTANGLAMLVQYKLGRNLETIASPALPLDVIAFRLVQDMQARGWIDRLVAAAREARPDNPDLFAVAQARDLAVRMPAQAPKLERIVRDSHTFLDIVKVRSRLAEIEAQVCRVEAASDAGRSYGTGFLVAPDVVMTNYHVVQPVIEKAPGADPKKVVLRFDYKRAASGDDINPGQVFHLDDDWLVDQSPPSPVDLQAEPKSGVPATTELDYALLRLDTDAGNRAVGANAPPGSPRRGWIAVSARADVFPVDSPMFIVQHPDAEPMQLALDLEAVIKVNDNGTRVQYRTNTLGGSSGSPCFNRDWELVALHHSGDPNFSELHHPTFNEGVPFAAIKALLASRNLANVLGG
jgi:V8-like Glu-specific endopeptidase